MDKYSLLKEKGGLCWWAKKLMNYIKINFFLTPYIDDKCLNVAPFSQTNQQKNRLNGLIVLRPHVEFKVALDKLLTDLDNEKRLKREQERKEKEKAKKEALTQKQQKLEKRKQNILTKNKKTTKQRIKKWPRLEERFTDLKKTFTQDTPNIDTLHERLGLKINMFNTQSSELTNEWFNVFNDDYMAFTKAIKDLTPEKSTQGLKLNNSVTPEKLTKVPELNNNVKPLKPTKGLKLNPDAAEFVFTPKPVSTQNPAFFDQSKQLYLDPNKLFSCVKNYAGELKHNVTHDEFLDFMKSQFYSCVKADHVNDPFYQASCFLVTNGGQFPTFFYHSHLLGQFKERLSSLL